LLTRLPDLEHIDQLVFAFVDFRDAVDVVDDRGDADGACGGGQVPAVPPPLAVTVMDSPGSSACHADRGGAPGGVGHRAGPGFRCGHRRGAEQFLEHFLTVLES
jgi:hypothetical protein